MSTYKIIKRRYYETQSPFEKHKIGLFIARGQWADGHLAYSRLDNNGNVIEDEETAYVQLRGSIKNNDTGKYEHCLYMQRI